MYSRNGNLRARVEKLEREHGVEPGQEPERELVCVVTWGEPHGFCEHFEWRAPGPERIVYDDKIIIRVEAEEHEQKFMEAVLAELLDEELDLLCDVTTALERGKPVDVLHCEALSKCMLRVANTPGLIEEARELARAWAEELASGKLLPVDTGEEE